MSSAANAPASPPRGAAAAGCKGRVLVVDDDRLVLATLVQGLSDAGYEVIDADNGDDAILLAREHRPQLALLDIRMEGKSGFDVAETLRDAYGIPFMFLSAFADEATLAKVQALGAEAYLVKPLDVSQIVPSVSAVLARLNANASSAKPPSRRAPAAASANHTDTTVAMAVGVLMHRYSLQRGAAAQRLQRLADDNQLSLQTQAEKLLAAVEELARSAL